METQTMSLQEAAAHLGIGKSLAYELARRGEFPGLLRLGKRRYRVSWPALEQYLQDGGAFNG